MKKYLKDNEHNNLDCLQKYVRIFVFGHYLFLEFYSFPEQKCSLLETGNVHGQISVYIFAPNGGYCLFMTAILTGDIVVLIWGMWLCYKIRNAPPAYNESKIISWAIYNAMFVTSFLMVVRLVSIIIVCAESS